jgi:hypothetical protein
MGMKKIRRNQSRQALVIFIMGGEFEAGRVNMKLQTFKEIMA